MNKQQLASKIWESANKMRSKIEAHEYKDYILGFMFYKYLSETQIEFLQENDFTSDDIKALSEDDSKTKDFIQKRIGYFIAYNNLFSTWLEKGKDFDVSNVRDALSAFSRLIHPSHTKVFKRIFHTLETGLSKLGDSAASQTKAISDLIQLIKVIPVDARQNYDVLGFIYEYLIGMFAANAGKKAGEFYTPHEVSVLMSEIIGDHLKDRETIQIYDPTSGSGSLLINIGQSIAKHIDAKKIQYYAQELKENTYNLTRMNLVMRGILPDNIRTRNADTLEDDWPYFDESHAYNPLYVDAVVSNPPYSQAWDPSNKGNEPRYARFGLAPKTKADFAFLLHDLYHLKPDGIMTIVLPHGVLFRGGDEGKIRKNLIEQNHIDAIIGLPSNIFFGTGITTIIMVLKQKRTPSDILFIDASKGFNKVGKNNVLRASDIKKIADTVINRERIDSYSRMVSRDEIRKNEYNLNIPRYVDSSEAAETWDIYASMFGGIPKSEIALYNKYWTTLDGLKESLFTDKGAAHCALATDDIDKTIKADKAVAAWTRKYTKAFGDDFAAWLKSELIGKMMKLNIGKQEALISDAIFERLKAIALVDKYSVYQTLDDEWAKTAIDLEIIQTEGFDAVRKVDPRLVLKKKDGKEQEIQDGWMGRVIPFELVQATLLKKEADALKAKEARLSDIQAAYSGIIDSLTEEEKDSDLLNEDKDAFVNAEVAKKIKEDYGTLAKAKVAVAKLDDDSFEKKLVRVQAMIDEEKELKTQIKKDTETLHMRTKQVIEALTDAEAKTLLEAKWIAPLMTALNKMPGSIIADLVTGIRALADKYATTYEDVAKQIDETKTSLSALLGELTGNKEDMKGLREFQALLKGK